MDQSSGSFAGRPAIMKLRHIQPVSVVFSLVLKCWEQSQIRLAVKAADYFGPQRHDVIDVDLNASQFLGGLSRFVHLQDGRFIRPSGDGLKFASLAQEFVRTALQRVIAVVFQFRFSHLFRMRQSPSPLYLHSDHSIGAIVRARTLFLSLNILEIPIFKMTPFPFRKFAPALHTVRSYFASIIFHPSVMQQRVARAALIGRNCPFCDMAASAWHASEVALQSALSRFRFTDDFHGPILANMVLP
jgi:hypothetical protein